MVVIHKKELLCRCGIAFLLVHLIIYFVPIGRIVFLVQVERTHTRPFCESLIDGIEILTDAFCHTLFRFPIGFIPQNLFCPISLLALNELDVGLLDDVQLDGVIIIAWLVPAYLTEIFLQILRLKTVAVIGQDLIAQQAQFLLWRDHITQVGSVEQYAVHGVPRLLLRHHLLHLLTFLLVELSQLHRPHHVTIRLTDSKEVLTFLHDMLYLPSVLCAEWAFICLTAGDELIFTLLARNLLQGQFSAMLGGHIDDGT